MRKLAANSPVAPIKSSAIRGYARSNLTVSWKIEGYISAWWMLNIFIDSNHSSLRPSRHFWSSLSRPRHGLPTFKAGNLLRLIMPFAHRGDTPKQLAGLRASRETQPFRISSLRRHPVSNANAITLRGTAALSDGKAAALQFSLGSTKSDMKRRSNRASVPLSS